MNQKTLKYILVYVISIFFLAPAILQAEGDKKENQNQFNKTSAQVALTTLNINNISSYFFNNGISDISPQGNSGFVYPKGSGKTAVFTSGLLWGAKVSGVTDPFVGGTAYRTGLVPGKVLSDGTADVSTLDKYRIYRVRPDVYPNGPSVDLSTEAGLDGLSQADVRAQYELDWNQWPASMGAPFNDVDGDGQYNPAVDIPGVKGADQTLWFVANDLTPGQTQFLYGANPLGIECQVTIWAYNQSGALGNMYFRKYKLINVTNRSALTPRTFEDMYLSMWSDVDLGDAGDDFVGVDTTRSLQYCYNAQATDATYRPLPPPAVGFDFFQGPVVDSPGDSAIFDGKRIYDKKNLPMTAAYYFANGNPLIGDPPQGNIDGSRQFYNFFQGKYGTSGAFFTIPGTSQTTTFALFGDPQTGRGWLDGVELPAGDRRQGSASGPFNMAPGDTQEVVVAEIVAGAFGKVDRLKAIGLLKFYSDKAQIAYDNFFDLPVPPPSPLVNVIELDRKVVLDWGSNLDRVSQIENYSSKGHTFQGYNIYQLPTASSSIEDAILLATFDVVDGVGGIEDKVFNADLGSVVTLPIRFGNDTGLERSFSITTDKVKGGTPLINGIKYYFAVTAYSYNPDVPLDKSLETPLVVYTAIPQGSKPGVRYNNDYGDTLHVTHTGPSDGAVNPIVIDPRLLSGHTYKVTFAENEGEIVWSLRDETAGNNILVNQTNQSGDNEYSFTQGMQVKVQGPPPGVKQDDLFTTDDESKWGWSIPQGTRRFTWANADGLEFEGFNHAIGWASPSSVFGSGEPGVPADKLKNVLLILGSVPDGSVDYNPVFDTNDPNVSYAYRYGRGFANPPAKPEFAPYIINAVGGYSYQDFTKSVPLSAWDVEDPAHPRRLALGFLENNVAGGLVDGKWWPGNNSVYNNTASSGPREWLWIFDTDYSETPNPEFQAEAVGGEFPIMYFLTVNRRGAAPFSPGGTGADQFAIFPNKINTVNDVFTFVATAPEKSEALAKADVKLINVFPNPYYGVNTEELNKYNRFVTFTHLPAKATIRIFNLAGVLVKTIQKDNSDQYQRWDLANDGGLPVASGLYLAYIDLPDIGETKIVKVAIIQEKQILDRF